MKLVFDGVIYMIQNDSGETWTGPINNTWEAPREPGASVPGWMTNNLASAEAQLALLRCKAHEEGD